MRTSSCFILNVNQQCLFVFNLNCMKKEKEQQKQKGATKEWTNKWMNKQIDKLTNQWWFNKQK